MKKMKSSNIAKVVKKATRKQKNVTFVSLFALANSYNQMHL